MQSIEDRLKQEGIIIPAAPGPKGSYAVCKRFGDVLFVSGQGPIIEGKQLYKGKIGETLTEDDGIKAAFYSALSVLSVIKGEVGSLDNIEILKMTAFVAGTADFFKQPAIINGASELFIKAFGERGQHARSAVGVFSLPFDIPVEIEVVARIRGD